MRAQRALPMVVGIPGGSKRKFPGRLAGTLNGLRKRLQQTRSRRTQ